MKIRSYILIITSLMGMLACSEKTITPDSPEKGMPINIGTVSTRALVNGIEDINEFGVSIAISNNEENSDYASILHNERVYPNSTRTEWNYDSTRYWLNDRRFYFVASYPYSQDGTGAGSFEQREAVNDDIKRVGYVLNVDTYDDESKSHAGVDILTATSFVNTNETIPETVPLNFKHLLTKVNFKISQDTNSDPSNDYYITKVSLIGLCTNAEYLVQPYGNQFQYIWALENEVSYTIEKNFDGLETLRAQNEISVWGEEGGLLLIPQEIAGNRVKVRIDYLYQLAQANDPDNQSGANESTKKERFIEAYIPASTDLWQSGKSITYILSIANSTKINFLAPTVESWGTPQTGGSIIIK